MNEGDDLQGHKTRKFYFMILALFVVSILTCSCELFPSEQYINKTLGMYKNEERPGKREKLIFNLLRRMKYGGVAENILTIEKTLDTMSELYKKNNDESMLAAVDKTEIDTAYANCICVFYSQIKNEKGFIERYRKPKHRVYVERCEGLSFHHGEIEQIIKIKRMK